VIGLQLPDERPQFLLRLLGVDLLPSLVKLAADEGALVLQGGGPLLNFYELRDNLDARRRKRLHSPWLG
jgi:hypothetical protein